MKPLKTAILGASGLVGRTMLGLLEHETWVKEPPLLLVSSRSMGKELSFRGEILTCRETTPASFAGCDIALFSAGGQTSLNYAPLATAAGCRVVDNSSAFRMDPAVPLVVPEINGQDLGDEAGRIIANPNCSTIQIAMALAPLDAVSPLREVQVTTLQAVSGGGQAAVTELQEQVAQGSSPVPGKIFPRIIAGNVLPAIGPALDDGSFEEEAKVERELRKILGRADNLDVTCTATRVPVVNGHCAAVRAVFKEPVTVSAAYEALKVWPGLVAAKGPHEFSTPLEVSGHPEVHVGRLRQDPANPRALLLWVVADNLLKGAAWNAVQIARALAHNLNQGLQE